MSTHHDKHQGDHLASLDAALGGTESADGFLDSWVCWREACEDVRTAYERWARCKAPQRGLAFASYGAALDREDQAARVYSVRTDRVRAAKRSLCSP
jgi:hypothetical protein